jgi:hypothetical protein
MRRTHPTFREDAMKRPRTSIAALMTVVAVVALNIGIARALFATLPSLIAGVAPIAALLQIGVYLLIRRRGRARAFWSGFVACGTAALATLLWAFAFRGSSMSALWSFYAEETAIRIIVRDYPQLLRGLAWLPTAAAIFLVPQLLAAMFGGLLALGIARWRFGPSPWSPQGMHHSDLRDGVES